MSIFRSGHTILEDHQTGQSHMSLYGAAGVLRTNSSNSSSPGNGGPNALSSVQHGHGATPSTLLVVPQPINATKISSSLSNGQTGRKYQCKMCPQVNIKPFRPNHNNNKSNEIKMAEKICLKLNSNNLSASFDLSTNFIIDVYISGKFMIINKILEHYKRFGACKWIYTQRYTGLCCLDGYFLRIHFRITRELIQNQWFCRVFHWFSRFFEELLLLWWELVNHRLNYWDWYPYLVIRWSIVIRSIIEWFYMCLQPLKIFIESIQYIKERNRETSHSLKVVCHRVIHKILE